MDLIQETKLYIEALGYSKDDIDWIGCKDFYIPIDCFWNSVPQEYDAGFGSIEVAADLVIVFKDNSWLERAEYDGSEWWTYKHTPQKPANYVWKVNKFVNSNYEASRGLKYINRERFPHVVLS